MNLRRISRASSLLLMLMISTTVVGQPQWRLATGTAGRPISAIDIYRSNPDTMYALGMNALLRSTNNGVSWDSVPTHLQVGGGLEALRVDPFDARRLYVSHWGLLQGNDVHMSTDGGLTWRFVAAGSIYPADVVELSPLDHRTIYVGQGPGAIWRSTDRGNQWSRLPYGPIVALTSLVIDPMNDSILYAGHMFGTVLKSTDWGNSWQYSMNLNSGGMTRLAINPIDPRIIYATVPYSNPSNKGGVHKTTDAGVTWAEANNGLGPENRSISTIAINPANPLELFLGLGGSTIVFRTTNGGNAWFPFVQGLPPGPAGVNCITIDTMNRRVFAGVVTSPDSAGSGLYVWDRTTSAETIEEVPTSFRLYQNYPNPFNPITTIRFQIPKSDHVSLKVFDMLGREVASLVDGPLSAGSYERRFDARRLASGVYLYRLQITDHTDVKKLLLLR